MSSEAFVQLALNQLCCSQKELAVLISVSPTQISKWKKGDHLSYDAEQRFRQVLKIGNKDPEFVLQAGSLDAAEKWENLLVKIADVVKHSAETGYRTYPLYDEDGVLASETVSLLRDVGMNLPTTFPLEFEKVLSVDDFEFEEDRADEFWDLVEENVYTKTVSELYESLNDVYGFYAAYIRHLIFENDLGLDECEQNIDGCLMSLAACKVGFDEKLAPRFREFKRRIISTYESWILLLKERAFCAGIPLRAELMDIVYKEHDPLGHEAEAENLGINKSRLHPDIYMNELLVGMRIVHQVLPAIMKKLGIEEEFELDSSDLRLR